MTFLQIKFLPWVLLGMFLALAVCIWRELGFFAWVKKHWFLNRRFSNVLSSILIYASWVLLAVVLLDPRSGEIKIKGKIRQDRTIILIDTSTSMLAEDVKPNRLEKAVLMAKHFVRKAVGHQIAVMIFADITKKLVPFTTDLDLLDSRIDSVRELRNLNAGSSIGLAIEEAVQFFNTSDKEISGNILVITDGEENVDTEGFRVPKGISLALVGVGTKEGSTIPLKDSFGIYFGTKKSRGETIVTRLNEDFFYNATKKSPNAHYFLAQSYDLPTEKILDFFKTQDAIEKENDNTIRPVAMEVWAIPALVMMLVGLLMRFSRPFAVGLAVLMMGQSAQAQFESRKISPQLQERLAQMKEGKLSQDERVNLADQLVKEKAHELAQRIYEENLKGDDVESHAKSYFNWATSQLETGKINEALANYGKLEKVKGSIEGGDELIKQARENVKKAMVAPPPPPEQKQKDKDEKNQDQDKNQDQKQDQKQGQNDDKKKDDGKSGKENQKQGQGQSGKQDKPKEGQEPSDKNPFDTKNKDPDKSDEKSDEKKDQEKKDKDQKKDKADEKDKDSEGDPKDKGDQGEKDEGEGKEQKSASREKSSPILEQLKQDDRKLQLKFLDNSTQSRSARQGKGGKSSRKDW